MTPRWFLLIGGASLMILAVLQVRARPRPERPSFYTRFVNLGTLWSLICLCVGAGLVAIALGYWDPLGTSQPGEAPAGKAKRYRR